MCTLPHRMHPIVVLFLMMAFGFWIHRLSRGAIRLYRLVMVYVMAAQGVLSDCNNCVCNGRPGGAVRLYRLVMPQLPVCTYNSLYNGHCISGAESQKSQ